VTKKSLNKTCASNQLRLLNEIKDWSLSVTECICAECFAHLVPYLLCVLSVHSHDTDDTLRHVTISDFGTNETPTDQPLK